MLESVTYLQKKKEKNEKNYGMNGNALISNCLCDNCNGFTLEMFTKLGFLKTNLAKVGFDKTVKAKSINFY